MDLLPYMSMYVYAYTKHRTWYTLANHILLFYELYLSAKRSTDIAQLYVCKRYLISG